MKQRGEVSLFVVIFTTLLLTIVTVSFVRIMMNDQQQASTVDLSQSAYDSAQAGVEDAKRAILHYQSACSADPSSTACSVARNQLDSGSCNAFAAEGGISDVASSNSGKEVKVQSSGGNNALDQAYTCAIVTLNTNSYVGTLAKDGYEMIPLVGVSDSFDSVKVSWFTSLDYPTNLGSPSVPNVTSSPLYATWAQNRPPILRAQLIQFSDSSGFTLDDLDKVSGGQSNSNTLFLYPAVSGSNTADFSANDGRTGANPVASTSRSPFKVKCNSLVAAGQYSCSAVIKLPEPIGAGSRKAYLRLGALYNSASYQISLVNSTLPIADDNYVVKFDGVQPIIDSTGRANDLFRRVSARVKLASDFNYPTGEIYTKGNLCKNFSVTNDPDTGYIHSTCTP